jgi:hypothetical protein
MIPQMQRRQAEHLSDLLEQKGPFGPIGGTPPSPFLFLRGRVYAIGLGTRRSGFTASTSWGP